ncbi:MAG: uroporphyrinogen-III synthase [Alphaproteobacteria bacterium]|nr:uroporphyrinogen-III synthase [Alphaproteobacteria bacterium]MBU1514832.1 uroporphyrinogen-III synthase [Alphaproteobacteria bacterium]MBU2093753.1 uroporphyrinogen-III synthase [Alphaproteobacteria bacterium]MBU2149374.1 uroporphyrinogen-III synthase [Alphaproteobacteria bacterium]MBU2305334.1 uroporphyrinogen-III synthase [Alphaproteobacteria bacterium]
MAGRRQRIWITRAQPGAHVTAERVRAMGHDAVVAPLLAVRVLPDVGVDLRGVAALAFTSANGVRAFADASGERGLKVFAVGAATAQAARAAGFKSVLSADGDVEALAEGIAARRGELRGAVLHPGALEPAGDLAGALEKQGVEARRLILYETAPVDLAQAEAEALGRSDAVLLHSPRAAQVLAKLLKAYPAPEMRALGLSKAVVKPLARTRLAAKAFPPFPLEAALLNLIDRRP